MLAVQPLALCVGTIVKPVFLHSQVTGRPGGQSPAWGPASAWSVSDATEEGWGGMAAAVRMGPETTQGRETKRGGLLCQRPQESHY